MKYKFKQVKLSDPERLWLAEIAKSNFCKVDVKSLRVKLWNELPEDFNPSKIDNRLVCQNNLTLIGLWYVDPQNTLFSNIPKIFAAIKDLILKDNKIDTITAAQISTLVGISEKDAEIALKFIAELDGFFGSYGGSNTEYGLTHASFPQNDSGYNAILKFKTLEQAMEEYFVRCAPIQNRKAEIKKKQTLEYSIDMSWPENLQAAWNSIHGEYGVSKRMIGKRLNFILDEFRKKIIFRDIVPRICFGA